MEIKFNKHSLVTIGRQGVEVILFLGFCRAFEVYKHHEDGHIHNEPFESKPVESPRFYNGTTGSVFSDSTNLEHSYGVIEIRDCVEQINVENIGTDLHVISARDSYFNYGKGKRNYSDLSRYQVFNKGYFQHPRSNC